MTLKITNLSLAYDGQAIFQNLSLDLSPGSITGMIGPNGAGKSSLVKAMLGLVARENGQVQFNNQPLDLRKHRIAYVEQRKNLDLTFPIQVKTLVETGSYGQLGLFRKPGAREKAASRKAMQQVQIEDLADRQIGQLSGGQLQRAFVARAILQDADLIILDEPFVGIDAESEAQIMKILRLWKDEGRTILVIHHDLSKVHDYFDELILMNRGIIQAGPSQQVFTAENLAQVFNPDFATIYFQEGPQ
ncbi:metal ABC transporter ATP-binding protein [Streptococcus danieliae]|uniref:Metal ABC transporter ATP-binding protein n=1 Tax=Streptococcus danieliae TaxID=747656 RepID=A0A7Z0LBQ5_9STRE|nr:metal ABC transporter ATP-binding protein [Streptococcus danieliae]MBF0716537.1 metal ABC transporter ATP-binding protein [Streptococcus danieliae]NYS48467.1 metal ABC transporter ATP-binding protein [Streptococcus danieliae]